MHCKIFIVGACGQADVCTHAHQQARANYNRWYPGDCPCIERRGASALSLAWLLL